MDLNYLYSQRQLSLMHAGSATSRLARTRHLAEAGLLAYRIDTARQELGQNAGSIAGQFSEPVSSKRTDRNF